MTKIDWFGETIRVKNSIRDILEGIKNADNIKEHKPTYDCYRKHDKGVRLRPRIVQLYGEERRINITLGVYLADFLKIRTAPVDMKGLKESVPDEVLINELIETRKGDNITVNTILFGIKYAAEFQRKKIAHEWIEHINKDTNLHPIRFGDSVRPRLAHILNLAYGNINKIGIGYLVRTGISLAEFVVVK